MKDSKPVKLTRRQAAIIGAYTGFLAGPFSDLHDYIEETLGRSVFTHELANEAVALEIREASKDDFFSICAEGSWLKSLLKTSLPRKRSLR